MFERSIRARGLLAAIDTALARISSGTFGECVICGQEIGAKRFEAVPWTRYCLACQESAEKEG